MNFKQFITENNSIARTNALKKQQELVDVDRTVEVHKHDDIYEIQDLTKAEFWICLPTGKVFKHKAPFSAVVNSGSASFYFARDVIRGVFPAGEKAIARESTYAYHYAKDVIRGPWPPGEQAIAKNARNALNYADYVLKGPFPAGEKAIFAYKEDYSKIYANMLTGAQKLKYLMTGSSV